jgi:glycosyltransferase involved in cell wall biosynthesis
MEHGKERLVMQMSNPYLSVAIPTYNRRGELIECLRSIVPQAKQHAVRIYISDNASKYDVAEVVEVFRKEHPLIYYTRNVENVGLDANVRKVISMGESSYVWVFSDDDVMVSGALDKVLPFCKEGAYAWLLPNREFRNRDLSAVSNKQTWFDATKTIYEDPVQLLVKYGFNHYTYVGSLIIKLEEWHKISSTKYVHCRYFEHMCILGEMLLRNKAMVIPDALIYVRLGQSSFEDQAWMVWGHFLPLALSEFPKEYPLWARRKVLSEIPMPSYRPFLYMLIGRTLNFVRRETVKDIVQPYYRLGCMNWVVSGYFSLLFPSSIAVLLKKIVQGLHHFYNSNSFFKRSTTALF